MRWTLVSVVVLALILTGCGGSGESTTDATNEETSGMDPQAALDAALEKSFEESDAPGVVAAVQTPEYTWVQAMGVADRASEEPMTPGVHHRIGSVTKTFTATLLIKADGEGLLSLDDTIDQYIDGVPNGDKITLRQVANMTSGIASYTGDKQWQDEFFSNPERVWEPEELAQIGLKDSPLFDPGTEWSYSDSNYVLLGLVLEKATGEPAGDLYREQIIEPLGLKSTSFPDAADSSIPDPHAQGYTLQGQSDREPADTTAWSPSGAWTAGGMISTMDDLLVYGRALGTGKGLLSPGQQSERLGSFVSDLPPLNQPPLKGDLAYGLGFGQDHGWIGHNGEIPGYNTYLFYHPEIDAVVAVEVNSDIPSGDCPKDDPTMMKWPRGITCHLPADRIFEALAEALGKPAPSPPGQ